MGYSPWGHKELDMTEWLGTPQAQVSGPQCISNKFPAGADITGPGLLFQNHHQSSLALKTSIICLLSSYYLL